VTFILQTARVNSGLVSTEDPRMQCRMYMKLDPLAKSSLEAWKTRQDCLASRMSQYRRRRRIWSDSFAIQNSLGAVLNL
jgi:hypothetical protein